MSVTWLPGFVRRPLLGLAEHWPWKATFAVVGAAVWDHALQALEIYHGLLRTDPILVVAALALIMIDTVLGAGKAWFQSDFELDRWRQIAWKLIEYAVLVYISVIVANAALGTFAEPALALLDTAALLYICMTEWASTMQHLDRNPMRLLRRLTDMTKGDIGASIRDKDESGEGGRDA